MKLFLLMSFLILISCFDKPARINLKNDWASIQEKNEITFLTVNSSTAYEKGRDGEPEGFEYEMAKAFADYHKLRFKLVSLDSIDQVLDQLALGNGHIAAAGITDTEIRRNAFRFGPSYFQVYQSVVCKKRFKVKTTADLVKLKIVIPTQTSYRETLEFLKGIHPDLTWIEREDVNSEILLQEVWANKELCTIVDSHILDLHKRYLPELRKVFQFKSSNSLSWAINQNDEVLAKELKKWFKKRSTLHLIQDLKRKYFEFIKFDLYNLKYFNKRIEERLPKYMDFFKEAAKKNDLDWKLLAAVSYQESFWNPKAVSPTGVRGIMMLTRKTAKELKVKNRVDPKESIMGGAKYLKKLIKRIPEYVHPDDRIWYALASYNVGYYHLRDAMALSIWRNQDPTRWHSVKKVLPLLSQRKYYKRLPYGHARGLEPVLYVNRIKDFFDILKNKDSLK